MRICLISREYPPDTGWGGVGAFNYHMAHSLKRAGHDIEVISLSAKEEARSIDEDGVTVHRVSWKEHLDELNLLLVAAPSSHYVLKTTIALWIKFMELHRARPFDVVEIPEHLSGGLFHALTRELPLVVQLHTPHSKFISDRFHNVEPSFDNRLICILERVGILMSDLVISPSANLAGFVSEDSGYPLDRIRVVRYPVDTEKFTPDGPVAMKSEGNLTVFFAGRLEERKGVHYLIKAVPLIVQAVPSVRFILVGADTDTAPGGGSMLKWLKKELQESGCLDYVTFVPHIPLTEMPNYVRSADVCVVPSLYDNAPFTCIEAMSCGKPVVATTAGGMSEYARHNESGLIVQPRSSEALAQAITVLLQNGDMRKAFGRNARLFAEENLNLPLKAIEKEEIYRQALVNHNKNKLDPVYMKGTENCLRDALEVLCAYESMMFDVLYRQSLGFRVRHWWRFFSKRPKLSIASAIVSFYRCLRGEHAPLPPFVSRLSEVVETANKERYRLTMSLSEEAESSERAGAREKAVSRT